MHTFKFFEEQFQRQVREQEYSLNPFEALALGHLRGAVLDLGCGLGNLSLEAGRRGHAVVAVDASPTAVERIRSCADREQLPVRAVQADLGSWRIDRRYDTIVAIGLLMFFRRERALELLGDVQEHVDPGGRAILNVLVEGTTYMGMFDPGNYHLFGPRELEESFAGWRILESSQQTFPAPDETCKVFASIVAEKPSGAANSEGR
jgi:tellurite methyltransferase